MRTIKADLHNHLKSGSYMPEGIFNTAIDIAGDTLGEGGILGVVNFSDKRYENFSESKGYKREDIENAFYVPEKHILIVKGQEVPTKQGHLLVLGLERGKALQEGKSLGDTIKEAKNEHNAVIIADHPFYFEGTGEYLKRNPEFLEHIDAIEVENGEANLWIPGKTQRNANAKAMGFFMSSHINRTFSGGGILTSDGHSLYEIGNCYSSLEMPSYENLKNSDGISEALRSAVRNANPKDGKISEKILSRIGALEHIARLAWHAVTSG